MGTMAARWDPFKHIAPVQRYRNNVLTREVLTREFLTKECLTKECLKMLESRLSFAKMVSTKYDREFAQGRKIGDVIKVRMPKRFHVIS